MLIWTCRACGRDFPAPRSGRERCLACVVKERRRISVAVQGMRPPTRAPMLMERRDRRERRRTDRRIVGDRRVADIRLAIERRRAINRRTQDRRSAGERRMRTASAR